MEAGHAHSCILVALENYSGWPGEFQWSWIEVIQDFPDVRLLFLPFLPTLPPKREYNAVSAVADEVWQYHTGGNLTIFNKDRDTTEEGWSLHTALVGGDLASPRTVTKFFFLPGGGVEAGREQSCMCWKTSPQRYHVMRLVRGTSWQESDQSDNFDCTVEVPYKSASLRLTRSLRTYSRN